MASPDWYPALLWFPWCISYTASRVVLIGLISSALKTLQWSPISFINKSKGHHVDLQGSTWSVPCRPSVQIPSLSLPCLIQDMLAPQVRSRESRPRASVLVFPCSAHSCPGATWLSPSHHRSCIDRKPSWLPYLKLQTLHTSSRFLVCFLFLLNTYHYIAHYLFYLFILIYFLENLYIPWNQSFVLGGGEGCLVVHCYEQRPDTVDPS